MRTHLEIILDQPLKLPLSHHYIIQSAIYDIMSYDKEYSAALHDLLLHSPKRIYKPFCFSQLSGKYSIEPGYITFRHKIHLIFSAYDHSLINIFNQSAKENGIKIHNKRYSITKIFTEEKFIDSEFIKIKMLSPVTISRTDRTTGKTIYYKPDTEDFSALIEKNYIGKFHQIMGHDPTEKFEINPIDVTEKQKYVTSYKEIHITAWRGVYELKAEKQGLQLLYDMGIGSKNAQGFGLFEII